ncbi:hypothetical protein [Apilactobacillus quenuiae]|uniref:hypothetical protein n=1 Tax=Apilactobacillus quenuiae TaxID=2008377 RepID=UPI001CDB3F38|nr:hypothetical protein [Apilactobacillus quenuiae]
MGYFILKRNRKNKSWKTADTDTHGSAQWGNLHKLLANHYFSMSQHHLADNFNNTINTEQLDKLIKQQRKEMVDQ